MAENEGKVQGWLYVLRVNRFGMQYSRRRYFVLEDDCLKSFKTIPTSKTKEPERSKIIDSSIRVFDNGRECYPNRTLFIFTLHNTSNHNDRLKLGAATSGEASMWIFSLHNAAVKPKNSLKSCFNRKYQPLSLNVTKRKSQRSIDLKSGSSFLHVDATISDVITNSRWKLFGCQNGLRLFKEEKDRYLNGRHWDDHNAVMAVGMIDGVPEAVFRAVMALSASRTEWDFSLYKGRVVEQLDHHTDIIHIRLYNHWLPWGLKRRDLLLQRYWRREDDGTYVILYHSVFHRKCPPQDGYVRAFVKSGAYVITPMNQGKQCTVKHMLSVDWKFWKSYIKKAASTSITIRMVGTITALMELFRAKLGNASQNLSVSAELILDDTGIFESEKEQIKTEIEVVKLVEKEPNDEPTKQFCGDPDLTGLNDASDEFFDVPETADDEWWISNTDQELCYMDPPDNCYTLQKFTAQRKCYVYLHEAYREEIVSFSYGSTLAKDSSFNMPCSYAAADPSSFLVRGDNYLDDHKKINAKGCLMQLVAADWIRSDKLEDDLAGRYGSIVQKYAAQGGPEFFFVINFQIPGTANYSLAFYYMMRTPLQETPLLESFINGDDAFRSSRFKIIPYISKGAWIVKQTVGRRPTIPGRALELKYCRGKNYFEIDLDVIGSSTMSKAVISLILGYLNNLVIELAFLIQGNTREELPEFLLGTCRLNHLDISKAVSTDLIRMS